MPESIPDQRLCLTANLIRLERGRDEFLLANSFFLRPLYINRGREYVQNFLNAIEDLGTPAKIHEAFPADEGLLRMLREHRIVLTEAEQAAGRDRAGPETFLVSPNESPGMSLYLILTQGCNQACRYCLNGRRTYRKDRPLKMSREVAFAALERSLAAISPGGFLNVVLFGGEPLLNWPLAKEIIRYGEEVLKPRHPDKRLEYGLTSNLTFLPPDLIEWAQKYKIGFLCDLDGPAEVHDRCRPFRDGRPSFQGIVQNARRLVEAGLEVSLRATVTALNQDRLPEVAGLHRSLGGASGALVPVTPINSDEDVLPSELWPDPDRVAAGLAEVHRAGIWPPEKLFPFSTAQSLAKGGPSVVGCGAFYGRTPAVDASGRVFPCIYLVGIERFYLGDIGDPDYPDQALLSRLMAGRHVDSLEDCRDCAWRYLCGGGCPLFKPGIFSPALADPALLEYCRGINCRVRKEILATALWDLAETAATGLQEGGGEEVIPSPRLAY